MIYYAHVARRMLMRSFAKLAHAQLVACDRMGGGALVKAHA